MAIYNTALILLTLFGLPILLPFILFSKKRRDSVWHRLGVTRHWNNPTGIPISDTKQKPIWVHALSVGEILSAKPLLISLNKSFPGRPAVLTASTQTGYRIAQQQLKHLTAAICYFPLDFPFPVKQAIAKINPALVLIVETDIWPNFIYQLNKLEIPVLWVNARLSERSLRGYRHFSTFFQPLFSALSRICVQSEIDRLRFTRIGVSPDKTFFSGNLKYDQSPSPPSDSVQATLARHIGILPCHPILVAGSTHEGEEDILLKGILEVKKKWPTLRTVITPRDPKRASDIIRMAESMALEVSAFSAPKDRSLTHPMDVVVVDRMGILRDLYAMCDIAFVGGSLLPFGGHNPLEPAAYGKPILFGPDMRDFLSISRGLQNVHGAIKVEDDVSFSKAVDRLLSDADYRKVMGQNSLALFRTNGGATEKILSIVKNYI